MHWISLVQEEIENIKSGTKELRQFGFAIGGILFAIEVYLLYKRQSGSPILISLGFLIIVLGLALPKILLPFQKVWMVLAVVLGFIMTRVILSILFYFVITPIGFLAKVFGKHFLDLKFHDSKNSYWNVREKKDYEKIDTERQF